MEDLISIGTIGLIKTIESYRPNKAGHFCRPLY
jgi:DNA-directed RNA polymerase specialized sigma subunit